jgi:hypothetical protein
MPVESQTDERGRKPDGGASFTESCNVFGSFRANHIQAEDSFEGWINQQGRLR